MKRKRSVIMLAVGIMVLSSTLVCAAEDTFCPQRHHGPCSQELLGRLPAEKEMLFHQTMRQVRESTEGLRAQMRTLREEIKTVLTAETFNEGAFREKTTAMQALHAQMQQAMHNAVATLAKQFTAEEREILAQLIPGMCGIPGGRGTRARHR